MKGEEKIKQNGCVRVDVSVYGVKSRDIVPLNITLRNVSIGDFRGQNEIRGEIYRYRNGRVGNTVVETHHREQRSIVVLVKREKRQSRADNARNFRLNCRFFAKGQPNIINFFFSIPFLLRMPPFRSVFARCASND